MAPRMSAVRKLLQDSPVSFKQQPKNETARSSTPYRICSSRKAKKRSPKPTLHRAKPIEKPQINYQSGESGRGGRQPVDKFQEGPFHVSIFQNPSSKGDFRTATMRC